MSYDLEVYAPHVLDGDDLRALIEECGLAIGDEGSRSITVVRGARGRYSFTVDGPDEVEAEDVPAQISSVVLGSRHLYAVLIEGTIGSEIPHAARFAKRLARALDGAVIDQQTSEVWSRSRSRAIQRPARESRVATVDFDWFCLQEELSQDSSLLFVDTVARFLPEALPRRFGEYEPFQGKYAEAGREGFTAAWSSRNLDALLLRPRAVRRRRHGRRAEWAACGPILVDVLGLPRGALSRPSLA